MADALQVFLPIFPPGHDIGTAQSFATPLGPSRVSRILITWPAGCGGLVGMQVQASGGFAFPNQPGQFLLFDDYTYDLEVSNQTDTGNWSLFGFNRDSIEHEISIVYEYNYLRGNTVASSLTPIAL